MTRTQRAFDLIVAVALLPPALLIGLAVSIAVLADSPGGVLYRCTRIGRGGRPFTMLKFRKMRRGAEGRPLTMNDDDRLTPIGRLLAVTKLDELPQLWNVLKGDMRLVGPRPEVAEFVDCYSDEYREILSVAPGITGLAQLEYVHEIGLLTSAHESTRVYTESILPRKIELDRRYTRTRGLWTDIAILARTVVLPARALAAQGVGRLRAMPPSLRRASFAVGGSAVALIGAFVAQAGSIY